MSAGLEVSVVLLWVLTASVKDSCEEDERAFFKCSNLLQVPWGIPNNTTRLRVVSFGDTCDARVKLPAMSHSTPDLCPLQYKVGVNFKVAIVQSFRKALLASFYDVVRTFEPGFKIVLSKWVFFVACYYFSNILQVVLVSHILK